VEVRNSRLLGCDAVSLDEWFPTFRKIGCNHLPVTGQAVHSLVLVCLTSKVEALRPSETSEIPPTTYRNIHKAGFPNHIAVRNSSFAV
jgi:hypothetical protein